MSSLALWLKRTVPLPVLVRKALPGRARPAPPLAVEKAPALAVRILKIEPARLRGLFERTWRFVWVDVELTNTGGVPLSRPSGDEVVLVDSVGFAYGDLSLPPPSRAIRPGKVRHARYLFRIPRSAALVKLRLTLPGGQLAETGYSRLGAPAVG